MNHNTDVCNEHSRIMTKMCDANGIEKKNIIKRNGKKMRD